MAQAEIVALVPMRHHSERVPGKNYRLFAGKPLFYQVLQQLLLCPSISRIIVDTDSPTIMQFIQQDFPQVQLIERPKYLCDGGVAMNDVLLHDISQVSADYYLQTHATNPLLRHETINCAIDRFLAGVPMYDSLFGVTKIQTRFWDGLARAINHNPRILLRTQDLPPLYEENSCLYMFSKGTLVDHHNRIGERPIMYEIDRLEAVDIDEELDFRVAELLYLEREEES